VGEWPCKARPGTVIYCDGEIIV